MRRVEKGTDPPSLVSSVKDKTPRSNRKPLTCFNCNQQMPGNRRQCGYPGLLIKSPHFSFRNHGSTYFQIVFALSQVKVSNIFNRDLQPCGPETELILPSAQHIKKGLNKILFNARCSEFLDIFAWG